METAVITELGGYYTTFKYIICHIAFIYMQ